MKFPKFKPPAVPFLIIGFVLQTEIRSEIDKDLPRIEALLR